MSVPQFIFIERWFCDWRRIFIKFVFRLEGGFKRRNSKIRDKSEVDEIKKIRDKSEVVWLKK